MRRVERRYHEPPFPGAPITVPCRHCATLNTLDPNRIEISEGRAWQRCTTCDDWYLVRWDDAVALGIVKPVDAIDAPTVTHRD
jgi:hypothetical protein